MFKRYLVLTLAMLMVNLSLGVSAFAGVTEAASQADHAAKIKKKVNKIGTGKRIFVKLNNGTKIEARTTEIKQDSFVVTNRKTGATTEVSYSDAKKVVYEPFSTGATVALAVGSITAVVLVLVFASRSE